MLSRILKESTVKWRIVGIELVFTEQEMRACEFPILDMLIAALWAICQLALAATWALKCLQTGLLINL